MNSDLRVARRYCENNFIKLVNDCYEFLRTLKTKKEKSVLKQNALSYWIAQKQEY